MTEGGAPPARHEAVMTAEVLSMLGVRPDGAYLDGTLGAGGHAEAILEASAPGGRLLGLDRDPDAVQRSTARLGRFGQRATLALACFDAAAEQAARHGFDAFDGAVLDLGLSSDQLADPARGFSFAADGPLDMRMGPDAQTTAETLVNELPEAELADLIYRYGEEPRSRRIARSIVAARPLHGTSQLATVVARASGYRHGRTHPATRTFQALRIAVNDELGLLERALPATVALLRPGGRFVVLTFHSLEDRTVKHSFRALAARCICPPGLPECRCGHTPQLALLTKKPLRASAEEVARNPRARSAKLRAAARLEPIAPPARSAA